MRPPSRLRSRPRWQTQKAPSRLTPDAPLTASTVVTGMLPGFVWPVSPLSPAPICNGLSNAKPGLVFSVAEGTTDVRIFAESDSDVTLLVILPDGTFACNDDSEDGANRNPVVDLTNPVAGNYGVAVGRIVGDKSVDAQITVTTDTTSAPAMLEPMAPRRHVELGGSMQTQSDRTSTEKRAMKRIIRTAALLALLCALVLPAMPAQAQNWKHLGAHLLAQSDTGRLLTLHCQRKHPGLQLGHGCAHERHACGQLDDARHTAPSGSTPAPTTSPLRRTTKCR